MATGDHPGTAVAIAEQVGLTRDTTSVRTGRELRANGVGREPARTEIYARVDPDQKLELVEQLQREGHVVAMTGDGVNDAPVLRRADIGIALGQRGSDVAREAADMVITDDDLATIVTAIREGRGIYDNIRKVIEYLVAGNLGEILVVVVGLVMFPQLGVPLLAVQLLWINLLTDGLPALALGVDPIDAGVMRRPLRPRGSRLLTGQRLLRMLIRGALIATALASLVAVRFGFGATWSHARAVMFTTLVLAGLLYAYAVRGGIRGNRSLLWATLGAVAASGHRRLATRPNRLRHRNAHLHRMDDRSDARSSPGHRRPHPQPRSRARHSQASVVDSYVWCPDRSQSEASRQSTAVMIPTRRLSLTTGSALIRRDSMSRAAADTRSSGPTLSGRGVITDSTERASSRSSSTRRLRRAARSAWSLMTTSRSLTMPISRPSSTTGRWRKPCSSIRSRASATVASGPTVIGSGLIQSRTA